MMPEDPQPIRVQVDGLDGIYEFPAGTPDAQIDREIAALLAEQQAVARGQSPSVMHDRDWVDALPAAGGLLYSVAGGGKRLPTGAALAGLGGATGEAARQLIRAVQGQTTEVPQSATDRMSAMLGAGATQAGGEVVGRGTAAALMPAARYLYRRSMSVPANVARDVGMGDEAAGTQRVIEQGFADRVLPTRAGSKKAFRLARDSKAAATAMAAANPEPIPMTPLLQKVAQEQGDVMRTRLRDAGVQPDTQLLRDRLVGIQAQNPPTVTAERLLELKRTNDVLAREGLNVRKQAYAKGPAPPGSAQSVHEAIANAAKDELEARLGPEFLTQNAVTQARMGVGRAARTAAARPNRLTDIVAGSIGATGGLGPAAVTRAVLSPPIQAATAFGLPPVARYGPRVVDLATEGAISDPMSQAIAERLRALLASQPPQE